MALISPDTFNPLLQFVSVRLQQGVPIVDADWNEQEDVRRFELRAFLKWFVGDGVPAGNDGFRLSGAGVSADFMITTGASVAPLGSSDLERGLGHVGRCVIDGRDVIIQSDVSFRAQPLHVSQAGAAALASAWGVPTVAELPAVDAVLLAYLDVWERLVTPAEAPDLIFDGLGVESCARLRREWVVRVRASAQAPARGDADFAPGHSYYPLASLQLRAASPQILPRDLVDLRERQLQMLPTTLVTDLFGTSAQDYRRGQGRPVISLRTAINALLRGELPSSSETVIAPAVGTDFMSYAFTLTPGAELVGFWDSRRGGPQNQVFFSAWSKADASAAAAPATQITANGVQHTLPQALLLPNGDWLVVYETDARDIHYKHASTLPALTAAPQLAVADSAADLERHPFAVRSGDTVVFFWHRGPGAGRWQFRRRRYTATWQEADATWLDATGNELFASDVPAPGTTVGDFHAVADGAGRVFATFPTNTNTVVTLAVITVATAAISTVTLATAPVGETYRQPFLALDDPGQLWAVWRSSSNALLARRYDRTTNSAVGAVEVAQAAGAELVQRPCIARDARSALWMFWSREVAGDSEIFLTRRDPISGGWGVPRRVVAAPGADTFPFALTAPDGTLWLFWQSDRSGGQADLYFKSVITEV